MMPISSSSSYLCTFMMHSSARQPKHTCTHMHTHVPAVTHTHTHTHTQTCTQTHAHTNTSSSSLTLLFFSAINQKKSHLASNTHFSTSLLGSCSHAHAHTQAHPHTHTVKHPFYTWDTFYTFYTMPEVVHHLILRLPPSTKQC